MNYDMWLSTNPKDEVLMVCSICEESMDIESATEVNDQMVCSQCIETEFIQCDKCKEYFTFDDSEFDDEKGFCAACAAESEDK